VLEKNCVFYKSIDIVHDESTRGYYLFETYDDFEFWYYNLDDKTMHKVIFGHNPQRLEFNIDASKDFIDGLNVEAQDKGEYILESVIDFSIATSIGPEKFSAHVILKNYAVENNREAMHLTKLLIEDHLLEPLRPCVDAGVNKSIQNFRLLYSNKVGSTWVKEPRGRGYLKEFIISHLQMIKPCHRLAPIAPAATEFEGDVADNAINQVLEMVAPYLVGQQFDKKWNNMLTFKRTKSTYCELCKRNYNSNNTVFITVHETVVFLHCRRSEDRIFIGELGRAANELDADGFDDEPDADGFDDELEEGQLNAG